jgi:hypothetical protein
MYDLSNLSNFAKMRVLFKQELQYITNFFRILYSLMCIISLLVQDAVDFDNGGRRMRGELIYI